MICVELYDASEFRVQQFNSAMRELNWSKHESDQRMFRARMHLGPDGDGEILSTCETHLAIAASVAQLADFEGTVILGVPEDWSSLPSPGDGDGEQDLEKQ
jgi:hypothetical protein